VAVSTAPAEPPSSPLEESWLQRFDQAADWRAALALAEKIKRLPNAQAIMLAVHPRIANPEFRKQALKPFVFHGGVPYALSILEMAISDPDLGVQSWAFGYLTSYSFENFSEDISSCRTWFQEFGSLPIEQVLKLNAARFAQRLEYFSGAQVLPILKGIKLDMRVAEALGFDLAGELQRHGFLALCERWLISADQELLEATLELAQAIPSLIGILRSDPNCQYSVGYYGLCKLTSVTYAKTQDAAYWEAWWHKNQERLPAEMRGMQIPSIYFNR
jgi:hypothetical protein